MAVQSTATTSTVGLGRPKYPIGIPEKFSADGVVQRFPGNTTICHVPGDSTLLPGLRSVYAALSSHPILSKRIHLCPNRHGT